MSPRTITPELERNGYVFLRNRHGAVEDVAAEIGHTLTPWDDGVVQQLVPRAMSTPNTYSGIFGLGQFPFHTDLAHWQRPPRYLLLQCIKGYVDVPTLLLDGKLIANAVSLDILRRAIVRPRRPQAGVLRPLCLWQPGDGENDLLRWDEVFLKPASRVGELAFKLMREQLNAAQPTPVSLVEAGDALVIDNWRMLHSRPPIVPGREDRELARVYLERLL